MHVLLMSVLLAFQDWLWLYDKDKQLQGPVSFWDEQILIKWDTLSFIYMK
jgi:hypothetical protein